MSEDQEPARLSLESSGSSSALRRALSAAKDDLPAPDHVEAMLARFPIPVVGPGGGGGAPIAGTAGAGTTIKILGGLAIATMVGGGTYLATRSDPAAPIASATVGTVSATVVATVTATEPVIVEPAPTIATSESASATHTVKIARATAASSDPPRPEMDILKEARAAAQSNPSRALQLVNEHANGYPKSSMAQEREMIRIQALLNQGKRAEAKALADAFKKAHPNSAYSQRLDSMF